MIASARQVLRDVAREAMRARGFDPDFPRAVLEEVRQLAGPGAPADRRDLRELPWTSIDNDDSRDLDQLTVAETISPGHTRVRVAIADVDVLVHRGSAIDQRAAMHTTSVYTAAAVFPMLPERLSTDLTSLDPGQDRAALVVEFTVREDGSVTAAVVVPALVRNHAQLAYSTVGEWLDGHAPAPPRVLSTPGLADNLRLQDVVAQSLRRRRHARGALTLNTRQSRAVFQGDALEAVTEDHPNRAKELIEEFMIAANAATAATFVGRRVPRCAAPCACRNGGIGLSHSRRAPGPGSRPRPIRNRCPRGCVFGRPRIRRDSRTCR